MTNGVFVTGTDTDIGKTYVTALLVKALRQRGQNAGYFKAALSGADVCGGTMIPGDAAQVCETAHLPCAPQELVAYTFVPAVSPHLAAKMCNTPILLPRVQEVFGAVCHRFDFVVAEGSGGIVCPLRHDGQTLMLTDVMRMTGFPLLLVADAGLGTINHAVLSVAYARAQGFALAGVVLNRFDAQNPMHLDNKAMIEALAEVPVVACVAPGDTDITLPPQLFR